MPPIDEKNVVFAWSPPKTVGQPATMVIGFPEKAWEYMKDGATHNISLERLGVPIRMVFFGGKDHDTIMKSLQAAASKEGVSMLDERRTDFNIPLQENPQAGDAPSPVEDKNGDPLSNSRPCKDGEK